MSSSTRVQKIMFQPISLIFRHLQNKTPVQIWLYDRADVRIEGVIIGFDEFMNVVLDNASEVYLKNDKGVKSIGRIMLKGDNITLISPVTTNSMQQ